MPLVGHQYVNKAAGARLNRDQAYRIVVRIGGDVSSPTPAACFFTSALQQLRADATERVLIFSDSGDSWLIAGSVVAGMKVAAPAPDPNTATGKPKKSNSEPPWYNSSFAEVVEYNRNDEGQQLLLTTALRTASRVVWGDTMSKMPNPLLPRARRKPYEVVWTWCHGRRAHQAGSSDEHHCQELPQNATDHEVQVVRARGARHDAALSAASSATDVLDDGGGPTGRSCTRLLAVRSSWTGSQWYDLTTVHSTQAERERKRVILTRGEWMLENTCLAYSHANPARGSERWNILAQAHPTTRQPLWPLPWRDLYAEYVPGWLRLDSETADHWLTNMVNASTSPLFKGCTWHNSTTAFVTTVTMDNLYHALIHALPIREFFLRVQAQGSVHKQLHLIPHYTQYWPKSFVRSVGWQMLARSLGVSASDWPAIAARAQELTEPGRCNCYRRIYGGHSSWMPPPYMRSGHRVADFRGALAASIGQPSPKRQILFQLRHNGVRMMTNEEEVRAAVLADPVVGGAVHFEVMEKLSVVAQYRLVSSSRALAGMHGMGLAWAMLLASDAGGKSSCLEITGSWSKFNRLDYYSMSRANGVHYMRLSQPNAPECVHCKRCSYRTCGNITASASEIVSKLRDIVKSWDPSV